VILTVGQVQAVLAQMEGEHALLARLLYGTGMRLMEALWLRVKDVDFAHCTLIVREGKANTDRTLMLPQALEDGLRPVGLCPFPSAAGSCRPLPGRGTAGGAGAQVSAPRRGMGLALGIPAGHAEPRSALGRPAGGITGSIRPSSGRSSGQ
jgi:integrase